VAKTNKDFVRIAAFLAVLLVPALGQAQTGLDSTRVQSDTTTRAIGRNTESALLPRPKTQTSIRACPERNTGVATPSDRAACQIRRR